MKKIILGLLFVLIVAAGAYYVIRSFSSVDPAGYLPENTVVYADLTNLPRTLRRWQETELAQIAAEPGVREFLKMPLSKLGEAGKNEAEEILLGLKPARIFWAMTSLDSTKSGWIGGFQYYGDAQNLKTALARLRQALDNTHPASDITSSLYEGVEIQKSQHGHLTLLTAAKDRWCLLANDEPTLHDMLDRLAGRNKSSALAGNADFQKGLSQLPKDPDVIGYVQVQPILKTLLAMGNTVGAVPKPYQLELISKVKSLSASFKLDGLDLRDSLFVQTTQPLSSRKLDHQTMHYTTAETIAYFASAAKWPALQDAKVSAFITPDILRNLAEQHLDTVNMNEVFGPEIGWMLTWPQSSFRPELLVSIPVVNPDVAKKLIKTVSASLFPQMTVSETADTSYYSYPSVKNPLINPTLAVTKNSLLFGLADTEVRHAVEKPAGSANLESATNFAPAKALYQQGNEAFGYFDSKMIFDRGYNALKPVLTFGAAMIPGMAQYIDTSKLPDSALITKHLTPITFYQRRTADGIYIESTGPLTLDQLFLLGGGSGWYFTPKH